MSSVLLIIQSLLILITTHLACRVVQRVLRKSPLDNLPGPAPAPWLMGHLPQWLDRHGSEFQRQIAQDYGPIVKMQSMMGKPLLYVYDLRALNTVLIKQQTIYEEEEIFIKANILTFGPGLLSVVGDQHRKQRKMLKPAFSAAHMRNLLPIFYNITDKARFSLLRDALIERVRDGPKELDVLTWMSRTALEVIAQGGIGVSVDPLTKDVVGEYPRALKELVPTLHGLGPLRFALLIPHISEIGPAWLRRRLVELTPHQGLQKMKGIVDGMARESVRIYEEKKAALRQGEAETSKQIAEGKDILSLLMRANMAASEADKLSEDEVIAQMSLILFAATDTTSNSTARTLERLAQNEGVQARLRQELVEAQREGHMSYDELMRLPLLDATVRETLRTDPLANLVIRQPTKDVILPLSEPIHGRDGTLIRELPIPKGTEIIIGVLGHNTNKALWGDDASEWKPERWLAPLPSALGEAPIPGVYSNLMSFLGGGRSCIGFKFSELEMSHSVCALVGVQTFKFDMANDKPIVWNVASVRYPTVGRESNAPEMPMKVSML
ncbi:hypothetical protein FOMPIDRAFT_40741 [Fomitopsis schrenkii]|uniref:Cytochrome P450 n=1 Tax=Fomitopsis schrenkii TaxID=2126942 RepID=S8DLX6_FOMSC|nr:hypothetical protein FOMPIDRAFT_40741 [Fomitopsis schrenkii]